MHFFAHLSRHLYPEMSVCFLCQKEYTWVYQILDQRRYDNPNQKYAERYEHLKYQQVRLEQILFIGNRHHKMRITTGQIQIMQYHYNRFILFAIEIIKQI